MKKYYVKESILVSIYVNKESDLVLPVEGLIEVERLDYLTHWYEIKKSKAAAFWAVVVKKFVALKKAVKE